MKLLLIGDFHGKVPKINTKSFDLILCTGDLPYGNETRDVFFKNFEKFKKGLKMHEIVSKKNYIQMYKKAFNKQEKVLEWLNNQNKPVYSILGNHDYDFNMIRGIKYFKPKSLNTTVKKYENIKLHHTKVIEFPEFQLLLFGGSVANHKDTKLFRKRCTNRFNKLFKQLNKKKFTILLVHDPPHGVLDKIKNKNSPHDREHVGDKILAKFVKKYQPNIVVCGHMHENQGKKKIGKTVVINTGYAYEDHYAILELDKKIKISFH